jgi:hypothetical protein
LEKKQQQMNRFERAKIYKWLEEDEHKPKRKRLKKIGSVRVPLRKSPSVSVKDLDSILPPFSWYQPPPPPIKVKTSAEKKYESREQKQAQEEYARLLRDHPFNSGSLSVKVDRWIEVGKGDFAQNTSKDQIRSKPEVCDKKSGRPDWLGLGTILWDNAKNSLFHGSRFKFTAPFLPNQPGNSFSPWPTMSHHWGTAYAENGVGYLYEYKVKSDVLAAHGGIPRMLLMCGKTATAYHYRFEVERGALGRHSPKDLLLSTCVRPVPFNRSSRGSKGRKIKAFTGWFCPSYEQQVFLCGRFVPQILTIYRIYIIRLTSSGQRFAFLLTEFSV